MLQQRFLYSNANHYVIFGADSYDDVLVVLKCPRSLRGAPPPDFYGYPVMES